MSSSSSKPVLTRNSSSNEDFSANPPKVVISGATAKVDNSSENSSSENVSFERRGKQLYASQVIITADVPNELLNNLRSATSIASKRNSHSPSPTPSSPSTDLLRFDENRKESTFVVPDQNYPLSVDKIHNGFHHAPMSMPPIPPMPVGHMGLPDLPPMNAIGKEPPPIPPLPGYPSLPSKPLVLTPPNQQLEDSTSQTSNGVMGNPDLLYPRKNSMPSIQPKSMNSDLTRMNSVPVLQTPNQQQQHPNPENPPHKPNKPNIPKIPGRTREPSFGSMSDAKFRVPQSLPGPQLSSHDDNSFGAGRIPSLPKLDEQQPLSNLYSLPVVNTFSERKSSTVINLNRPHTPNIELNTSNEQPKMPQIPSLPIISNKGGANKLPQIPSLPVLPTKDLRNNYASVPIGQLMPNGIPQLPTLTTVDEMTNNVPQLPTLPGVGNDRINTDILFRSAMHHSAQPHESEFYPEQLSVLPPPDPSPIISAQQAAEQQNFPIYPELPLPGTEPEPTGILLTSSFDQYKGASCKIIRRQWMAFSDRSRPIAKTRTPVNIPTLTSIQQQTYMSYNPSTQYQQSPQQQQNVPQLLVSSIGNSAQFANVANMNKDYVRQVSTELISQLAKAGDTASFSALIKIGIDPNRRDGAGVTPLHYTAYYGMSEMVSELLDIGAKYDEKDANGLRPIDYAITNNFVDIGIIFAEHGIMLNIAQAPGYYKLVFDKAQMSGNMMVMDHLVQCGYRA